LRNHALEAKRNREIEWGMLREMQRLGFFKTSGVPIRTAH